MHGIQLIKYFQTVNSPELISFIFLNKNIFEDISIKKNTNLILFNYKIQEKNHTIVKNLISIAIFNFFIIKEYSFYSESL